MRAVMSVFFWSRCLGAPAGLIVCVCVCVCNIYVYLGIKYTYMYVYVYVYELKQGQNPETRYHHCPSYAPKATAARVGAAQTAHF